MKTLVYKIYKIDINTATSTLVMDGGIELKKLFDKIKVEKDHYYDLSVGWEMNNGRSLGTTLLESKDYE